MTKKKSYNEQDSVEMGCIIHKGRAIPLCILLIYLSLKIIVTNCQYFGNVNSFKCSVKENALTLSTHVIEVKMLPMFLLLKYVY